MCSRAAKSMMIITILILLSQGKPACGSEPHVYLINNSGDISLTGFRIEGGEKGIITCLHGVGYKKPDKQITARNGLGEVFTELEIRKVDLQHDLALLGSLELDARPSEGLALNATVDWNAINHVDVIGYPQPLYFDDIRKHFYLPRDKKLRFLKEIVDPNFRNYLKLRKSPDLETRMLVLDGSLRPGHSGSPIVDDENRVLAIADGGIERVDFGWAIPISVAQFVDYKGMVKQDVENMFAAQTDGFHPGKLFAVGGNPDRDERLLTEMAKVSKSNEDLGRQFSQQAQELRKLVKQLGQSQDLSISIADLRVWLAQENQANPNNQSIRMVADKVESLMNRIRKGFDKGEIPDVIQTAFLRSEIDIAIAKGDFAAAKKLANDQELVARKLEWEQKQEEYATMLSQRAAIFRGLKDWNSAIDTYLELLKVRPYDSVGIVCLSEAYDVSGDTEQAFNITSSVLDYYKNGPIIRMTNSGIKAKVAIIQYKEIVYLQKLKRFKDIISECTNAISILDELRKLPTANGKAEILSALSLYPEFYYFRANALVEGNLSKDAIADLVFASRMAEIKDTTPNNFSLSFLDTNDIKIRLATLYRKANDAEKCKATYLDIVKNIGNKFAKDGPEDLKKDQLRLAGVLNNFGYALHTFHEDKDAALSFKSSLEIYNTLINSGVKQEIQSLPLTLNNLSEVAKSTDGKNAIAVFDDFVNDFEQAAAIKRDVVDLLVVYKWHRSVLRRALGDQVGADKDWESIIVELTKLRLAGRDKLVDQLKLYINENK